MLVWVLYDISDNRKRNRAAKICKNKGLNRVQKSVFLGMLDNNKRDELRIEIEDVVNRVTDSVYIFPSSKENLKITDIIGHGFDKGVITNDIVSRYI